MRRYTLSLRIDLPLINAAKDYFDSLNLYDFPTLQPSISYNLDRNGKPIPIWNEAVTLNSFGNKGVVIPLLSTTGLNLGRMIDSSVLFGPRPSLFLYKDYKDKFHAEFITLVPDTPYKTDSLQSFTGFILTGLWPSNLIRIHSLDQKMLSGEKKDKVVKPEYRSQLFSTIEYKKIPPTDYKETSISSAQPENTFTVTTGDRLISNISDYLKCFDNIPNSDHKYQIKLCVLQPTPGSREPWAFHSFSNKLATHNPVFVGHTFLILTVITPVKTTVRNVGFYPTNTVHPFSPESQGVLNDDEETDYDVTITYSMTSSQFFNVLNYILKGNNKGFNYNLNSNNCTTFAVDALSAGYLTAPRTIGTWTNGKGMNPGDLGEDIRKMKSTSSMTITTTSGGSHPNIGTCA